MTKKDYIAFARIIGNAVARHEKSTHPKLPELTNFVEDLINDFSVHFECDNFRFDRKRFKAACLEKTNA